MNETELARMLKRRPELLAGSIEDLHDAIQWARFPLDLDSITILLPAPPNAARLQRKNGTLTLASLNWMGSMQSRIHQATDGNKCDQPVIVRAIVYTKQKHNNITFVYGHIYKAIDRYAIAGMHLITQTTLENRIDPKNPRIALTITKKGGNK
jgi:hypothetical protein